MQSELTMTLDASKSFSSLEEKTKYIVGEVASSLNQQQNKDLDFCFEPLDFSIGYIDQFTSHIFCPVDDITVALSDEEWESLYSMGCAHYDPDLTPEDEESMENLPPNVIEVYWDGLCD